jgi:hypothetical protein
VQNLVCPAQETDRIGPRSSLASDRAAYLLQAAVGGLLFAPAFGVIVGGPRRPAARSLAKLRLMSDEDYAALGAPLD